MKKNSILALGLLTLALSVSSFALGGGALSFNGQEAVAVKAEAATNDIVLTFPDDNQTNNKTQGYTATWTAKTGDQEFEIENFNNNNWDNKWTYIKCGSKKAASVGTIATASAVQTVIESVEVEIGSIIASSVNDIYLQTSSDGTTWSNKVSLDESDLTIGTKAFTIAAPAANMFYKLSFDCEKSSNGVVQVNKLTLKAATTAPSVSVDGGSSIELKPAETSSYDLKTANLPEGSALEVSVDDTSIAEAAISEDKTKLNVSAKTVGNTAYTVTAKDSSGAALASFTGSIIVANEPVKITFGSATGSWNLKAASSTFTDSDEAAWTATVVGTTSFTPNTGYSQIGSSSNPASSISLTGTLENYYSIDSVTGIFGGFNSTKGDISFKAGSIEIGTGALNATSNVTVSSTSSAIANSISVEIGNIAKGVKLISLEYSVSAIPQSLFTEVNAFVATYITPYSGEAKEGETCKAKYEAASNAYSAMTEKARQLFDVHTDYAGAKAIFDYWYSSTSTDSKGAPLAAAKTSEIASVSSIGLFAVAGVVVLGLFFVNKKKAE